MNLEEFKSTLNSAPEHELLFQFESGSSLAQHFHVTEVGKVTKDFVDCGGVRRQTESCRLQTLVANDVDHRLKAGKLAKILELASPVGLVDSLPVEAEIQTDSISVFTVQGSKQASGKLVFELASKQTACLAPDSCGLEVSQPMSLPVASSEGGG